MVITSLVGALHGEPQLVARWRRDPGRTAADEHRALLGELPQVVGIEPFLAFPSAVLLMTFLSFFIGIFLQLMWEELPITEPL